MIAYTDGFDTPVSYDKRLNIFHDEASNRASTCIISCVPSEGKRQIFCRFFKHKELHVRKLFTGPCTDIKESETAGNRLLYLLHFFVEFLPSIYYIKKSSVLHTPYCIFTNKKEITSE